MSGWILGIGLTVVLLILIGVELWRLGAWRDPKPWDGDGE